MLVVFGGLPGTGKTTIAQLVARRWEATYLQIDLIEQTLRESAGLADDLGEIGYAVAYRLAEANLGLGRTVVADNVNPIRATRRAWRQVAGRAGARILEVEMICSDAAEHERRVECRQPKIHGLKLPDWNAVRARRYDPWPEAALVIDTAKAAVEEAASLIVAEISANAERGG